MIRPKVSYARADDGVTIAYSVVGEGPLTIVVVPAMISHLEVAWEEPAYEHFMSCLAECMRVVTFDRRGIGLSEQFVARGDRLALPRMAADVAAVMDASGTAAAALFGVSQEGPTAIHFAATHPDRTLALTLAGASAKLIRAPDYPFGVAPETFDGWVALASEGWGQGPGSRSSRQAWRQMTATASGSPAWNAMPARAAWSKPRCGPQRTTTCVRYCLASMCRRWCCIGSVTKWCRSERLAIWPSRSGARASSSCPGRITSSFSVIRSLCSTRSSRS
jgi:pimeloyl-ACP methyl ester carboxylesterase